MKKLGHCCFTICIMLACLVPGAGMLVLGPSTAAGNEVLAGPPRAVNGDGTVNLDLLSDAADYFSDHFAFRQELATAESALRAGLFHSSAQPGVALGRDGWLFYAETLDDYTGADSLSRREAYCAARSLKLAQSYAESRGAAFVFTIAPNKLSLYPEHGPQGLVRASLTGAGLVEEQLLAQGVHYAELFEAFSAQEEELYLKLDSHWNNRGAALGHDLLLEGLGLSGQAFQKTGSFQDTHRGDLYEMLYPASPKLDRQFEFDEPLQFEYASPIRGVDDLRIQTASGGENGPLLMFRDSFGNALHGLMAESFSQALFSRAMPYSLDLMEEQGAQYVVVEIVERNLKLLAQAPFRMPAPEQDPDSLPWGREDLFQPEKLAGAPAHMEVQTEGAYIKVSGTVDASCDPDSPVYLLSGDGSVWEAFPVSGGEEGRTGFTAYFSQESAAALDLGGQGVLHAAFRSQGKWTLALNSQLSQDAGYLMDRGLLPPEGE